MPGTQREITLQFLASPMDVNFGGNIHGGAAMKWLDEAGYVCACAWSGYYCVTAFVGDINFNSSIAVGHLVKINAKIIHTGRTSMHLALELYSSDPIGVKKSKSIHCMMVFVALDKDGKPVPVPEWRPVTEEDVKLENYAIRIREVRKVNRMDRNEK